MGYKRTKTYRLVFEDPEFEGLEVRAKSVPTGSFLKITELMDLGGSEGFTSDDMDKIRDLFGTFAGALIDWNLEDDDDQPVPATLDGLLSQDLDFVLQIIKAWMEAVTTPPESLGKGSPSGVQFPEGSIPMAVPSPDLPKLVAQSYS